MILVTVGTEQYPFNVLMDWVDLLICYRFIEKDEEVLVQYGASNRLPDRVKIYQRLPEAEFKGLVEEARLVIAHCGEGTALLLESLGKPYILVPRSQRFGEHVDDHQLEMADAMEKQGIAIARSPGDLVRFLAEPKAPSIAPQGSEALCQVLCQRYEPDHYRKLMLVCSSGGHFKAMQGLQAFWQQYAERSWVTFRTASTESELKSSLDQVHWAYSPTNRNIPNLIRNLLLAARILRQQRPDLVVSTGAGVGVPFLLLAKHVYGSKVVFVESKTRLQRLSLSARILKFCAALDELVVQSRELAERYPEATWVDCSTAADAQTAEQAPQQAAITVFQESGFLSAPPHLGSLEAESFVQNVRLLCEAVPQRIVVDMGTTQSIDAAGLDALYTGLRVAQANGIELVLWSVNSTLMTVLTRARFDRLLKMEPASTALRLPAGFQPAKPPPMPPVLLQRRIQRAVSIVVATLGLFLATLLTLPIALAIRLESSGPIFISQVRRGLMGQQFRVWKFRTTLLSPEDTCKLAQGSDLPNCQPLTIVGRFLRQTRLDRLPLYWSVLVGDLELAELQSFSLDDLDLYLPAQWAYWDTPPSHSADPITKGAIGMEEHSDKISLGAKSLER